MLEASVLINGGSEVTVLINAGGVYYKFYDIRNRDIVRASNTLRTSRIGLLVLFIMYLESLW